MSGRLSTLWSILLWVPAIAGACTSGYISEHLPPSRTFFIVAALALLIACVGFWRPYSVFSQAYENPQAISSNFFRDIKRLVKHRAIYPAVLILFLWNFSPGANTPLQFYLTNQLHASDSVYAYYTGIYQASFIPTFLLYGFLWTKVSLNNMLKWGTIIGVLQMLPLALIHSGNAALLIAVPMGLMGVSPRPPISISRCGLVQPACKER
jgi:Na+/melibiose symporter-like transporter